MSFRGYHIKKRAVVNSVFAVSEVSLAVVDVKLPRSFPYLLWIAPQADDMRAERGHVLLESRRGVARWIDCDENRLDPIGKRAERVQCLSYS